MTKEDIRIELIELARTGFVLPMCPECGMPMSLDEALSEECISCHNKTPFDFILWNPSDMFPDS
ncbi:MAG: hypothetical protein WC942_06425 [Clostridia bacterium]|jgi:hypothetical protein